MKTPLKTLANRVLQRDGSWDTHGTDLSQPLGTTASRKPGGISSRELAEFHRTRYLKEPFATVASGFFLGLRWLQGNAPDVVRRFREVEDRIAALEAVGEISVAQAEVPALHVIMAEGVALYLAASEIGKPEPLEADEIAAVSFTYDDGSTARVWPTRRAKPGEEH